MGSNLGKCSRRFTEKRCDAACLRGSIKLTSAACYLYISGVSTVAEIRNAIEKLSPPERAQLELLIWPDWDRPEGDSPPGVREKLAEAAEGCFQPRSRSNINKIVSDL
jgi:hypothetical protein